MGYIDYSKEPRSDIAFIDMKSFYASIECYVGKVKNLSFQSISLETKEGFINVSISDILTIDLEVEYESA